MSGRLIAGGILAGTAIVAKLHERYTTTSHDRTLKKAYKTVTSATPDDASVYVDHIDVEAPNTRGKFSDLKHRPDLATTGFRTRNVIVEVENEVSLTNSPGDAISQLKAFSGLGGYTCVLVTPDSDIEHAEAFVEKNEHRFDGEVTVMRATQLSSLYS